MSEHALSRGEVKRLIITAFHTNERVNKSSAMTVARTARMCGYKPSHKFRTIMNEMVFEQTLIAQEFADDKAIAGKVVIYALNPANKKQVERPRQVKINGQLELW